MRAETTATNAAEPLLRPEDVRIKLNIGQQVLRRYQAQGLPYIRMNARVHRFKWSEIERWLANRSMGEV